MAPHMVFNGELCAGFFGIGPVGYLSPWFGPHWFYWAIDRRVVFPWVFTATTVSLRIVGTCYQQCTVHGVPFSRPLALCFTYDARRSLGYRNPAKAKHQFRDWVPLHREYRRGNVSDCGHLAQLTDAGNFTKKTEDDCSRNYGPLVSQA